MDQLTFRHNFNLEASDDDPNLGFDGGVLEISTDGGKTFQYVPCRQSFVIGGYNRTISTDRGSPIAGLRAWSGNSEGFITTVVNVPIIIDGKLRWRMASDTSGSSEGWRVDDYDLLMPFLWDADSNANASSPTPTATATLPCHPAQRQRLQLPLQLRLRPPPPQQRQLQPTATATAAPRLQLLLRPQLLLRLRYGQTNAYCAA